MQRFISCSPGVTVICSKIIPAFGDYGLLAFTNNNPTVSMKYHLIGDFG